MRADGERLRGQQLTRLCQRGAEEHAAGWRMFQEGDDELAVVVECRGSADQRHQAVGPRQSEQTVDVVVGETLRDPAQDELPAELRTEMPPPVAFVLVQSGRR